MSAKSTTQLRADRENAVMQVLKNAPTGLRKAQIAYRSHVDGSPLTTILKNIAEKRGMGRRATYTLKKVATENHKYCSCNCVRCDRDPWPSHCLVRSAGCHM